MEADDIARNLKDYRRPQTGPGITDVLYNRTAQLTTGSGPAGGTPAEGGEPREEGGEPAEEGDEPAE